MAGPFRIAAMAHEGDDMMMMDTPVLRVAWPVNGWVRGYSVQLCDGDAAGGTALPHGMVHHVGLANYSRRELLYPMVERLMAVGKETPRVSLPGNVGVPLARGDTLGLYSAFHDIDGHTVERAYVIVTLPWIPAGHANPIVVMPFFADVNLAIGGTSAWDLAPGRSEKSAVFTMPLGGSLLALGGHVHDYAHSVTARGCREREGARAARYEARRGRPPHLAWQARLRIPRGRIAAARESPLPGCGRLRQSNQPHPQTGGHGLDGGGVHAE